MRKILLLYIFFNVTLIGYCQNKLDSLSQLILTVKGKEKVDLLVEIANEIKEEDKDYALQCLEQALNLAQIENYTLGMARTWEGKGRIYLSLQKFDDALNSFNNGLKAIESKQNNQTNAYLLQGAGLANYYLGKIGLAANCFTKAADISKYNNDSTNLMKNSINAGASYVELDNLVRALEMYQQAMSIAEAQNNKNNIGLLSNNIGVIYRKKGEYNQALDYFQRSLNLLTPLNNSSALANTLNNLGLVYENLGEYDMALKYYEKTLEMDSRDGYEYGMALTLNNLGIIQTKREKYDEAKASYNKSKAIMTSRGDKWGIAKAQYGLGQVYMAENKSREASRYLLNAYSLSKEIDNEQLTYEISEKLYLNFKDLRDFKNSLKYFEISHIIKDSLHNEEETKNLTKLEAEYEFQKERDSLNFAREKQAIESELKLSRQRLIKNMSVSGMILTLVLLTIIWRYSVLKKRANKSLAERNKEVKLQNNEITQHRDQLEERNRIVEQQKAKLERVNSQLKELNEEKNMLMGVVAHDLKSPLNQIAGLSSLAKLATDKSQSDLNDYLNKIQQSAAHSTKMITRILDVEAIENKLGNNISLDEVNVYPVIKKVLDNFEIAASNKGIEIHYPEENIGIIAKLDKNLFEQVIQNLVSNALKFSKKGTEIHVNTQQTDNKVHVSVIDEGPGITSEDQKKLFGKYQRLSATPTNGEHSTGLGLSIVKKFTEAMNGEVICESKPGKGTTFTVSFPIK